MSTDRAGQGAMRTLLDALERVLVVVAVTALGVIVLTVSWQVLARYVTEASTAWAPELAQLSFVWLALLAIPLGVRRNRHMMLDVWSGFSSPVIKAVVTTLATAVVVVVCGLLAYYGIEILETTFRRRLPGLGISAGWINLAVPVGFVFSLLFAIEVWWDAVRRRDRADDLSSDDA